ncbi:unnamed protein product [Knipowitschia caucasica]|uniref:CW-type domain-containing protein n=1 Tax=Knipowitschia caucasica TaxID=637954 RepID=A0AAV2MJP9_KNICA
MAKHTEQGIRLSSMCPTFLNSNSTSHTWPFSAVAELIDNASDPGVLAKQIWINVHEEAGQLCLSFTDNGCGMTPNKLHKMLSFGFTDKGGGRAGFKAIGVYGNGFKSGSMRLGKDALIFTKNGGCQSVGMLSQTYLENIKAQCVIVPIVPFNQQTKSLVVTEDSEASLAAVLQHSIVSSQEQIQAHFDSIPSKKGTKILIWNIRRAKDGKPEIDFETDPTDFRLPEIQIKELKESLKISGLLTAEQNLPDMHYSLKAYLDILYLRPRIHIILRENKIPTKLVSQQLTHVEYDVYKPHFSKDKVKVTFGINKENRKNYGIMMYHKNRLIKAYEQVGCQLKTSGQRAGVGVIGVIECDFLKPAHNKQDFEYTKEYRLTLGALGMKLNDYWKEVMGRKSRQGEDEVVGKEQNKNTTPTRNGENSATWLQCEECLKWRSVPVGHYSVIPENWTCSRNPNPRFRSCSSQEETNAMEDLHTASYTKTHYKRDYSRHKRREQSSKVVESGPKHVGIFSETVLSSDDSAAAATLSNEAEISDMMTEQGPEADAVTQPHTHLHTAEGPEPSYALAHNATEETGHEGKAMALSCMKRKSRELFPLAEKKSRLHEEVDLSRDSDDNISDITDRAKEDSVSKTRGQNPVSKPYLVQKEHLNLLEELTRENRKSHQLPADTRTPRKDKSPCSTREIGCQVEKSAPHESKASIPQFIADSTRAVSGFRDPEQKKEESCKGDPEDNKAMLVQETLRGLRVNVVVLLSTLLPQLDLSDINVETSDVDTILQQIIEVNDLNTRVHS